MATFYDCEPALDVVEMLAPELKPSIRERLLSAHRRGCVTVMVCDAPSTIRLIWFEGTKTVTLDLAPS